MYGCFTLCVPMSFRGEGVLSSLELKLAVCITDKVSVFGHFDFLAIF